MDKRNYEQFGIAALIPGMQHMLDLMQQQLDDMRQQLAGAVVTTNNDNQNQAPKKEDRRGKASWEKLTPEERSREMKRRQRVAARKRGISLEDYHKAIRSHHNKADHPRDPAHPGHAKWLANVRKASKKYWRGLSPSERSERIATMVAGKAGAA